MQALAFPRPPTERRPVPLEAFSRTEKIIAFCRVLLASGTLAVVVVDPKQPSFLPDIGIVVLGSYLVFSIVLFGLVRGEFVRQDRIGYLSTAADIVWVSVITIFTERGPSPFFLLHVFVISSVSVRWGLAGAVPVTVILAFGYPLVIYVASRVIDSEELAFHRAHLFRPLYLLAAGYLIGYLGEHERRSKRKLELHARPGRAGAAQPEPGARDHPSRATGARSSSTRSRGVAGAARPRQRDAGSPGTSRARRATCASACASPTTDPCPLPFAGDTEGFLANDLRPGGRTALCYDVRSGAMHAPDASAPTSLHR